MIKPTAQNPAAGTTLHTAYQIKKLDLSKLTGISAVRKTSDASLTTHPLGLFSNSHNRRNPVGYIYNTEFRENNTP